MFNIHYTLQTINKSPIKNKYRKLLIPNIFYLKFSFVLFLSVEKYSHKTKTICVNMR